MYEALGARWSSEIQRAELEMAAGTVNTGYMKSGIYESEAYMKLICCAPFYFHKTLTFKTWIYENGLYESIGVYESVFLPNTVQVQSI